MNRALQGLCFRRNSGARPRTWKICSPREDAAEIRYLMNRARRTGVAASQIGCRITGSRCCICPSRFRRCSTTAVTSGFVLVLEDTSDMLRAQKAAAWHEVARRIAHEIKNPLTPIALCAERIGAPAGPRRLLPPETQRILRECARDHLARSGIREDAGG